MQRSCSVYHRSLTDGNMACYFNGNRAHKFQPAASRFSPPDLIVASMGGCPLMRFPPSQRISACAFRGPASSLTSCIALALAPAAVAALRGFAVLSASCALPFGIQEVCFLLVQGGADSICSLCRPVPTGLCHGAACSSGADLLPRAVVSKCHFQLCHRQPFPAS